jgi:hypothetical protein
MTDDEEGDDSIALQQQQSDSDTEKNARIGCNVLLERRSTGEFCMLSF